MRCAIEGCDKKAHSRGWCGTHYARWRRTGSAILPPKPRRICDEDGCESDHYSLGYCIKHYLRLKKTGTTHLHIPTVRERIESNILKTDSGCWIYLGEPGKNGYSRMSVNDRLEYVHRLSYEEFIGPIPTGLSIDHLCRVRMCVNPTHLEPVTLAENTRREMLAQRKEAS